MNSVLFPHLNMGHTQVILRESGTTPLINELFIMQAITGIASFIISTVILSKPAPFY